jgi:hypothetical protein
MDASIRAPLQRGPRPRPPTGGGNEAIKAKELEAQRQVALVVSPAEATTSAAGSLTSGDDHLSTDDSSHLRTSGLPATAAASPRTKRSSLPPSYGVRTRPSKNAASTSTTYDALYDPRTTSEQCGRRHGRRHGCGRPTYRATVARAVDGQPHPGQQWEGSVGGGVNAIQAKEPDTRQLTAPTAGRPRVDKVCLLRKDGEHPSPPNVGGRSGSPAHAGGRTPTWLAFHPSEDDEHP